MQKYKILTADKENKRNYANRMKTIQRKPFSA